MFHSIDLSTFAQPTVWHEGHTQRKNLKSELSQQQLVCRVECDQPRPCQNEFRRELHTSALVGSALRARAIAEMAWVSSSFSACTVPSRRHASTLSGFLCTSASRAYTASDRMPCLNRLLAFAKLCKSFMKGLLGLKTYSSAMPSMSRPAAGTALVVDGQTFLQRIPDVRKLVVCGIRDMLHHTEALTRLTKAQSCPQR